MVTFTDAVSTALYLAPDWIYVAIGCSQKHHRTAYDSPQEYPPQIAGLTGRKVCILIDPDLENPLRACELIGVDPTHASMITQGDVTLIAIRDRFDWSRCEDMDRLVSWALDGSRRHLIVQDYSGTDLRPNYPLERFPTNLLLSRVLYDMTGGSGSCWVDFTKTVIHLDDQGVFIQPVYAPIAPHKNRYMVTDLNEQMRDRFDIAGNYVHRLYRISRGIEPPREWCSPDEVLRRARRLFFAYGIPVSVEPFALRRLVIAVLQDFAATVGDYLPETEAIKAVDASDPRGESVMAIFHLLRAAALTDSIIQNAPTQ